MEILISLFIGTLLILDFISLKSEEISNKKKLNFILGILLIVFGFILIWIER